MATYMQCTNKEMKNEEKNTELWMIMRLMMATTAAGKRDKNNELCVQIWWRAKRRSFEGTKPKREEEGGRETDTEHIHKLHFNNRIGNKNFVQSLYVLCFFVPLLMNKFQVPKMQAERKGPKIQKKRTHKRIYTPCQTLWWRFWSSYIVVEVASFSFIFVFIRSHKINMHSTNNTQSIRCIDLHQRIEWLGLFYFIKKTREKMKKNPNENKRFSMLKIN